MSLEKRVAVITGATGELGSVLAQKLSEYEVSLALLDRHPERLAALAGRISLPSSRLLTRDLDLRDPDQVCFAAGEVDKKFGRVDILLHLVGGWTGGKTLLEAPLDDFILMLDQHLWTSLYVIRAFVPQLIRNGWGRIIVITSPHASHPVPKGGPYAIGKSAQEALLLTMAGELAGTGVTANMLAVSTIDTDRSKVSAPSRENASWTTPEEISASILHLLSDEAGTINGVRLPLYGSS